MVGVGEYLPYNIWAVHFLEEQGYKLNKNILFQDNQSAMLMERNGRTSCTGNSRHINVRYFFIKDRIDKGEVSVDYCPTYLMLADYFTKPLQGRMFKLFRNIIMGYLPILSIVERIPIKERVDIRKVRRKSDRIIRTSSEEKRNLMNGILANIEREPLTKDSKKITWEDLTNVNNEKQQSNPPQSSIESS